ncbi:hypothetical protein ACWDBO_45580 [Streptomyces mirabilis]|nr:hypothetical protein [Streptomyces sp. AK02-04a]MDX3762533.1 hypothetical protein [Streptomyces sp. AK02-04a]
MAARRTGAVLAVICHLVGTALLDRILNQSQRATAEGYLCGWRGP